MATFRFGSTSSPCKTASAERAQPERESSKGVKDDGDPNQLLQCPYDKNHQIRASRFPYHVIKCRDNHPELASQLKTCPFNARHILPKHELAHHTETCENRVSMDTQDAGKANERRQWHVPVSTWVNPNMTENWDEEIDNDAAPFVWGVNTTFTQQRKTNPTNTLSCRVPSTLPWCDDKPELGLTAAPDGILL